MQQAKEELDWNLKKTKEEGQGKPQQHNSQKPNNILYVWNWWTKLEPSGDDDDK